MSFTPPLDILQRYWGHSAFRLKQEEIVTSVINGNDTLALLPTGGGKSICFQVPALCLEGVCLVVSPLMALMYDQVNNLKSRGISAAAITSAMHYREIDKTLDQCVHGQIKFLYVSPERLKNNLFKERFKRMKVAMIAVDEAHCISQWGYDFRPSYLEIATIRELHPNVPVLALTASATHAVVSDIQAKLHFKLENAIGTSFARPNLAYVVVETENKESRMLDIFKKIPGCGIVYCGTRAKTREMADYLYKNGMSSGYYHAGMTHAEREAAFKRWLRNETRIICATNAFGMGIDKPDVRVVVHMDVPPHPEAYFQEAGRAGRDGQQAYGALLYNKGDILLLRERAKAKFPPIDNIRKIYNAVGNHYQLAIGAGKDIQFEFHLAEFVKTFQLQAAETMYALQILEAAGYIALSESVMMPARLTFAMQKPDLYSFQVAHPQLDAFVKLLLRMYGGLFDQYVGIREGDIARQMRSTEKEVIHLMHLLQKNNVLDYLPASDTPKLTFLTGREQAEHLRISAEIYDDRMKVEMDRVEAMVRYLEKDTCRSIQLLEYFGEKDVEACGQCDVCRKHAKKGLNVNRLEHMWADLTELLLLGPISLDAIGQQLRHYDQEELQKTIRHKLDIGELTLDARMYLSLPNME
jgi:ATP-dependent DNA helicase RecQ